MSKRLLFQILTLIVSAVALAACGRPQTAAAPEPRGMQRVADAAIAAGEPELALRVADFILEKQPNDVAALITKADVLYALGQTAQARDAYRSALALDLTAVQAQLGLGRTLMRADPAAAQTAFEAVLLQQPANEPALNNLGVAHDLQGHHLEAQQVYRRALEVAPDDAGVLSNMAMSMALAGGVKLAPTVAPLASLAAEAETALSRPMTPSEQPAPSRPMVSPDQVTLSKPMVSTDPVAPSRPIVSTGQTISPAPTAPVPADHPAAPIRVATAPVPALEQPAFEPAGVRLAQTAPRALASSTGQVAVREWLYINLGLPASDPFAVANAGPGRAADIAALPAPRPVPQPAAARRSGLAYVVQVAALESEADAQAEWRRLSTRWPDLFADRTPAIYQTEVRDRVFWRLRTGAFASAQEANDFCARLQAAGGACWTSIVGG